MFREEGMVCMQKAHICTLGMCTCACAYICSGKPVINDNSLLPPLGLTSSSFQCNRGLLGGCKQVVTCLTKRFGISRGKGGEPCSVGSVKATGRSGKEECGRVGCTDGGRQERQMSVMISRETED